MRTLRISTLSFIFALTVNMAAAETYVCNFPKSSVSDYAVTKVTAQVTRNGIDTFARTSDAVTKKYATGWVDAEVMDDQASKIRLGWEVRNLPYDSKNAMGYQTPPIFGFRLSIDRKGLSARLAFGDKANFNGRAFLLIGSCTETR